MKDLTKFVLAFGSAFLFTMGCSSTSTSGNFGIISPAIQPAQAAGQAFTQVEYLARPAVGEGILLKNTSLNTYNAVGPDFIARALANPNGPEGQAAAPTLADGVSILTALVALKPPGSTLTVGALVGALLPDVLRIDTALNFRPSQAVNPLEVSAYGSSLNAVGSPVGGRKLTDDTIDITLAVLTGGTIAPATAANATGGDGVPYYRPAAGAGSTNLNIGHQNLNGQAKPYGASTFPYLAPPN